MHAEGTKAKKARLVYDPVSKTLRGIRQDGPPGLERLLKAVWSVIKRQEDAGE